MQKISPIVNAFIILSLVNILKDFLSILWYNIYIKHKEEDIYEWKMVLELLRLIPSLANNKDELNSSIEFARSNSSNGDVLIEEYLKGGKEYSIECISNNKTHIIGGMSTTIMFANIF